MKINIKLSEQSINNAINKLNRIKDDLQYTLNDIVEVLAYDGAAEAQSAYGSMATAEMQPESMTKAKIVVSGGDQAIIAEFGAGYDTMEEMLEKGVILCSAGNPVDRLEKLGLLSSMKKVVFGDRLFNRVKQTEFVLIDETSREKEAREIDRQRKKASCTFR